ncbi:MAG: hypothetical protein JW908_13050 [Anaerolineales bacterium]|nr:hypothetical protein [Anaerolineales bacterium]
MSEAARMWIEIGFNITYLVVIWLLVGVMIRRYPHLADNDKKAARLAIWAFGLLALGDTGHVGFRVLAYALGDINASIHIGKISLGLVGTGAFSTAITVTFFYMLILFLWRERFNKKYNWFSIFLLAAGIVRLGLMASPMNEWNSVVPPQPWSLWRNIPLIIQGSGVACLILRDSTRKKDKRFQWIGIMILVSFACYLPVILWVQQHPMLGMLMIPKTIAYVVIGFIAYNCLYRQIPSITSKSRLSSQA